MYGLNEIIRGGCAAVAVAGLFAVSGCINPDRAAAGGYSSPYQRPGIQPDYIPTGNDIQAARAADEAGDYAEGLRLWRKIDAEGDGAIANMPPSAARAAVIHNVTVARY